MHWLNLRDETIQLGFTPLAAGAFIGEHSYSRPNMPIAEGRPDVTDLQIAEQFGKDCLTKLEKDETLSDFYLKKETYLIALLAPYSCRYSLHSKMLCAYGECIEVCPTHAIALSDEGKIEKRLQMHQVLRLVKECPNGARVFDTPYTPHATPKMCGTREPELFI